jgi:hypothetical protein
MLATSATRKIPVKVLKSPVVRAAFESLRPTMENLGSGARLPSSLRPHSPFPQRLVHPVHEPGIGRMLGTIRLLTEGGRVPYAPCR